jgi:D-lactate dehydrogenase
MQDNSDFAKQLLVALTRTIRAQSKLLRAIRSSVPSSGATSSRIRVACFDSAQWTFNAFSGAKYRETLDISFFRQRLSRETANLAVGFQVICCFVNDDLSGEMLQRLSQMGVQMVALRCAGFDRVSIKHARAFDITVARVPAYSPHAVAEHALGLLLTLNRKLHRAYNRTRDGNFTLDGLVGFDLYHKTAGVIGTGRIGQCLVHALLGFGCKVLCYDVYQAPELKELDRVTYVSLDELYKQSDFISIHAPLNNETRGMINQQAIESMKNGVIVINTSRGGLIDTRALLEGLKSGHIKAAGLDVYENESAYFFSDCSDSIVEDNVLRELLALNNVLVTSHQAFLTAEALESIANITMQNIVEWSQGSVGSAHRNSIYDASKL